MKYRYLIHGLLSLSLILSTGCPAENPSQPDSPTTDSTNLTSPTETGNQDMTSPVQKPSNPSSPSKPSETSPVNTEKPIPDIPLQSESPASERHTLFAIYMVGGDLEDDVQPRDGKPDSSDNGQGSGSADLREMVAAYQTLSESQRAPLDVVVAFGAARKPNWKGVKYADLPCLVEDSQDNRFGNADCYFYSKADTNMASSEGLAHFVNFANQRKPKDGKSIFEIWDHGVAYLGVGNDTNHGNDLISLDEMKQAFQQTDARFDMLAFDACLMASLEVAEAVQDHADYMVASQELEPGHGWQYTHLVSYLASNPTASLEKLGQTMVDSFIDDPAHQKRKNKTLSVLNLRQTKNLTQALDAFVSQLDTQQFSPLLRALTETQRFGVQPRSNIVFGVDLQHFAQNVETYYSGAQSQALTQALDDFVVYARDDGSKPNANGIAVYSLDQRLKPAYDKAISRPQPWAAFSDRFIQVGLNDGVKPLLQSASGFQTAQADGDDSCTHDGLDGHCYTISDAVGLKSVDQIVGAASEEEGLIAVLGNERLRPIDDQGQVYFATKWRGEWIILCDGDCSTSTPIYPTAFFDGRTERNSAIYLSAAIFNGEAAAFYVEVADSGEILDQWIVPLIELESGEVVPTKLQLDITQGDSLTFLYPIINIFTDEETLIEGDTVTFSEGPVWGYDIIQDQTLFYFVAAEDYQGNMVTGPVYETEAFF